MPVAGLLQQMQARREHCVGVVDEHGSLMGLAFREDALEEIVGPLGDEFDEDVSDVVELADGVLELRGSLPLPQVRDRLGLRLDDDEGEETIGGYLVARLKRLPRQGDQVDIEGYRAVVIDASRNTARRIRIERIGDDGPDDDAASGSDGEQP